MILRISLDWHIDISCLECYKFPAVSDQFLVKGFRKGHKDLGIEITLIMSRYHFEVDARIIGFIGGVFAGDGSDFEGDDSYSGLHLFGQRFVFVFCDHDPVLWTL